MIVEITKAHESQRFPKVGEFYKVKRYWLDPSEKVTLLYKIDPETHVKTKDQYWEGEPVANEYLSNCRVVNVI